MSNAKATVIDVLTEDAFVEVLAEFVRKRHRSVLEMEKLQLVHVMLDLAQNLILCVLWMELVR